jgi:hypothetical protein
MRKTTNPSSKLTAWKNPWNTMLMLVMRGTLGKLTSFKNPVIFKISDRTKVANWFLDA